AVTVQTNIGLRPALCLKLGRSPKDRSNGFTAGQSHPPPSDGEAGEKNPPQKKGVRSFWRGRRETRSRNGGSCKLRPEAFGSMPSPVDHDRAEEFDHLHTILIESPCTQFHDAHGGT